MTNLVAKNANYVMAMIDAVLGCDSTLTSDVEGTADCTCARGGRHFVHECLCGKSWVKA
jgi:hypothetical protein